MLSNYELITRLLLAAFLGSLIGFERERMSWAAGLRTHMLVCVGACLVMIVSAFGFADILGTPHVDLDPSRVAAQVISGIGFLGAGAILMQSGIIRGLTTAASVWVVAAIGLAVGGGLYLAAGSATAIILIILAGIKPLEDKYKDKRHSCLLHIRVKHGQMKLDVLQKALGDSKARIKHFIVQQNEQPEYDDVSISLSRIPHRDVTEVMERLRQAPGIEEVREDRE